MLLLFVSIVLALASAGYVDNDQVALAHDANAIDKSAGKKAASSNAWKSASAAAARKKRISQHVAKKAAKDKVSLLVVLHWKFVMRHSL